jgi:hypothetical protein
MSELPTPGDTRSGMTHLREWLEHKDNSSVVLSRECREKETHVSLLGWPYGRLLIPDNKHGSWLMEYAKELKRGVHSLFFAEHKTPVFRMHFDLDFCEPSPVNLDYLEKIARHANMVFRQFYPELGEDAKEWKVILLTAPPKRVEKDGVHLVKSGCHMIWPSFHVDQGIALQLRLNLLAHITRTWPPRPEGTNSYEDIIDETVLKANGLRMYGSDKASKCKECRGTRKKCERCHGQGLIIENRAYTLTQVLTPGGETDTDTLSTLRDDLFACVNLTSTRVSNKTPTPGFIVPSHAISNDAVKKARSKVHSGKRAVAGGGPPGSEAIDRSCPIFAQLEGYIRTRLSNQFKWVGIDLKHVFLLRSKGIYICKVDGPGSLYCEHVGRAHGSSTIYFEVDRHGISQRCFSPKITDGVSCKTYRGKKVQMNKWLRDAMFGGEKFVRDVTNPDTSLTSTEEDVRDPWSNFPHPDYPGMTYGEVARIPDMDLNSAKQRCLSTLPDPRSVHAAIVKDVPIAPDEGAAKKKRKRK